MPEEARTLWNNFVVECRGSFLQSWEWGEFQRSFARGARRFGLHDGEIEAIEDSLVKSSRSKVQSYSPKFKSFDGLVQFIEMPLPLGFCYWYAPRGPIVRGGGYGNVLNLRDSVKKGRVIFVRVDPAWPPEAGSIFPQNGWRRAPDVQPRVNWLLDITKPEDELLAAMHPKTRYNIRLAEKNTALSVRRGEPADNFDSCWRLFSETAARQNIRLHPRVYYEKMLRMPIAELWLVEYNEMPIAAHVVIFFGSRATYLHGGSSHEHRSLMAPYLLHWEAIKEAKRRRLHEYEFGGVDEIRWPGLTRFKMGFGGRMKVFVGAFDYRLRPFWYRLYQAARRLKR